MKLGKSDKKNKNYILQINDVLLNFFFLSKNSEKGRKKGGKKEEKKSRFP